MKTILSVLCMLLSMSLLSQNNPISAINISLPPNPDANIANWKGGTSMLTISAMARAVNGRPDVRVEDSKILVIIKKSGGKACGSFTNSSAPAANFTTLNKVWSGNNAVSLLGQECTLPPGDYELTVQLFANGPRGLEPISEEKTKAFTIKGNEQQTYQPPQPMLPANGTILKQDEIKKLVTFRWTPVVPRPQDPVTYRLRVWRMAEGQNSISATIIQQPILGNDVGNVTQAIVRLNTTSPNSNSPEIYVWNVQALNRDGKPIGSNNGTSEAFTITVQPVNDAPVGIKLVSPENGETVISQHPTFSWTLTPGDVNGDGYYKIKIVEIKGDESPEQAFKGNKPFFEKDSCTPLSFQYPSSAPKLVAGKRYAWNVQALNREGKPIRLNNGTSETFAFTVPPVAANGGRLSLVSPANGETVRVQKPTFAWKLDPTPADYDGDGYYKIKIVEIKGDESPEQAFKGNKPFFEKDSLHYFKGNKPHFEKDSLKPLSFQYPSSAHRLEPGKRYAWNIQALNREGKPIGTNNGTSENFTFSVAIKEENKKQLLLVAPANGAVLNESQEFGWDLSGDGYYKIKIVEIKGDESPEQAFKGNKPFFEKDSLKYYKGNKPFFEKDSVNRFNFQYPSSAPKLEEGKKYAWGVASGKLLSAVWIFRTKPLIPSCKNFKVTLTKNERASNKETCCFNITITNNYKGPLQINGFRALEKGFNVVAAPDAQKGWDRKPQKLSAETKEITWTKTGTGIPSGKTELGTICLNKIEKNPFYFVYEWLDGKANVLCKDSIQVAACNDEACRNDIIRNGGFVQGNNAGPMPSPGTIQYWTNAYGTPVVNTDTANGFIEKGCVKLSGNVTNGQAIAQSLDPNNKIIQGKKYKISIAVRFIANENTGSYVKIRAIAFNGSVGSGTNTHPGPSTDVAIIGRSGKIKDCGDWSIIELPVWTAGKDYSNIAVNAFTNDNTVASVWIDNITACETNESGCNEVQTDDKGNPIMPVGYGNVPAGFTCEPEEENEDYFNGALVDIYPGYDGTGSIYNQPGSDCFSIGGTLPEEATKYNCDDSLRAAGIDMTCEQLQELLNSDYTPKDSSRSFSPIPPLTGNCDLPTPENMTGMPFKGRDIIYIHGLQMSHLIDRTNGVAGATGKWPLNQNEYYNHNGYYKFEAYKNMLPHIQHFIRDRGHKNRYLIVVYDCAENAEVAVHAVLSQIRAAMQNGTGVLADRNDPRGTECFGRDFVMISHSTGALVADVALSIANKTKSTGTLQTKYGNLGFISDRCKGRLSIQGAYSGSNLAKIACLGQFVPQPLLTLAISKLTFSPLNIQSLLSNTNVIGNSILVDLTPAITRARWGSYINDISVPVFTMTGGHPSAILGSLKYIIHPGFDDGVLTMDGANANNNPLSHGPSNFSASGVKVFDMGIPLQRATKYYFDQRISEGVFAAASTVDLSPTGMVQPWISVNLNPQQHFNNHFSFIQSSKEHWFNATEPDFSENAPCDYGKTVMGSAVNNEEQLVVNDPSLFTPQLIHPSILNKMEETIKGLFIPYPTIKIVWRKGIPRATVVWKTFYIWKRTYHKLNDNCQYDVDYGYNYLFTQ